MARVKSGNARPPAVEHDDVPPGDERQGSKEPTVRVLLADTTAPPEDRLGMDGPVAAAWDELEIPEHGRHVYQASALGRCHGALVAGALGVEKAEMPGSLRGFLDEGIAAEPRILEMFHDAFDCRAANYQELSALKAEGVIAGYNPEMGQVQCWLEVGSSALVRVHPDQIVRINPRGETPMFGVVEAKAFGPSNWKKWVGPKKHKWSDFPGYAWQVSAEGHATGLPVYFVVGRKDRDEIDGGDAGAISEIDVLLVPVAKLPHSLSEVKARVLKAEARVKQVESGDKDVADCTEAQWPCAFFREDFCLGKPSGDEAVFEDVDDIDLGKLLSLHYAYGVDMQQSDEQKEAKTARDKVKEQIDKYMAEKGYARGSKMRVWSETGDEFEFEWVIRPVKAREASEQSFPQIKLVNAGEYMQKDAG